MEPNGRRYNVAGKCTMKNIMMRSNKAESKVDRKIQETVDDKEREKLSLAGK